MPLLVNFTNPVGDRDAGAARAQLRVRAWVSATGRSRCSGAWRIFSASPREQVHADYAGLNHCGWIHRVLVDGRDRLPEVLDRFDELQAADEQWRLFDPGLVRAIGMLPMEYLYFFYYRDEAIAHILSSGSSRGRQLQALNDALWPILRSCIDARDLPGARERLGRRDERSRRDLFRARARRGWSRTRPPRPATPSRVRGTRLWRPR